MPKTFRIIILGAGFSKPAGLPLGSELFGEVRKLIRHNYGSNSVESDIKRYKEYVAATEGKKIRDDSLDYEKFLGFLDTEHFLGFDGGDRLSDEGNASQSGANIRSRYRFADWSRTELNLDGLNESTIDWLFNEESKPPT